jgi:hypothetical protein
MQKRFLFSVACSFFLSLFTQAQTFDEKSLRWPLDDNADKRIKAFFATPGRSFGSEETVVAVENLTDKKLSVEFSVTYTDLCGVTTTKKFTHTVPAKGKAGGSPWFDGKNFSPECKETKKYGERFVTKIADIKLELVSVKELGGPATGSGTGNGNSGNSGNNGGAGTNTGGNGSSSNGNTGGAKDCKPVSFEKDGQVGLNCIKLLWWCNQETNIMNSKTGEFSQHLEINDFVVQWRVQGDKTWKQAKTSTCPINRYTITGLDACTQYEVRVLRDCGGGKYSEPFKTLTITTACVAPTLLKAVNVSRSSISVSTRRASTGAICDGNVSSVTEVEFKTGGGTWDSMICNPGQACTIGGLTPSTAYRVRARYKYPNNKYSEYTNEIVVTTGK